jgi:hypothetical protein
MHLLGNLEIHQDNVTNILRAAHMFNILEIVEACCKYIEKQLHPSNCLGIHKFAIQHDLHELIETAWNYILVKISFFPMRILFLIDFYFSRHILRMLFKIIMNFLNYLLMKLNKF